ncbi:arylsulfatase B-like [Ptychodera flava]|uniref:arylsulfatase B-like n=1 Tax=Ptychodera flava TaxID=63121 RepID=UPI00396A314E
MKREEASSNSTVKYAVIVAATVGVIAIVMSGFNKNERPPHIVFILADDLGWNDVGWNNPNVKTPHLNELAEGGVIFNQTYVQPLCSPSRAALMTGYYPFRTGLQHKILGPYQRAGLPLEFKTLAEKLKEVGYLTHIVGKWHLGHSTWDYTPTRRGFDSFFGHYSSSVRHYQKTFQYPVRNKTSVGYDFRDGIGVVQRDDSAYSTLLHTERAVEIISKHYAEYPLFLYFALDQPAKGLQVPSHYEDMYPNIQNQAVRKYYAKMSLMDEAVGNISSALKSRGLFDDTLLIFMSDNGALPINQGSNLPFRSCGCTLFDGGARVPAMIRGPLLKKTGYVNDGVNHITDWHTTLLSIAGIKPEQDLDGIDILDMIVDGSPSPRNEFVYNIDQFEKAPGAALRVGDWKLVVGEPNMCYPGVHLSEVDDWFPVDKKPLFLPGFADFDHPTPPANVTLLFNLKDDPAERNDLSEQLPAKVEELRRRLDEYKRGLVPVADGTADLAADAELYEGTLTPWL